MTRFYVIGGRQKPGVDTAKTDEWHYYSAGTIVSVDPDGSIHSCVEHVTPPDACASAHDPSILFKSSTLVGNCLYVPTQTELLVYTLPSFQRVAYLGEESSRRRSRRCVSHTHRDVRRSSQPSLLGSGPRTRRHERGVLDSSRAGFRLVGSGFSPRRSCRSPAID
jgi:hypothetical protein